MDSMSLTQFPSEGTCWGNLMLQVRRPLCVRSGKPSAESTL